MTYLTCCQVVLFAQLQITESQIPVYTQNHIPNQKTVLLPVGYAKDQILSDSLIQILQNTKIKNINLYYTDYPKGADLTSLNNRRIKNLSKAIDLDDIHIHIYRQMSCMTKSEAQQMFHGWEITLPPHNSDYLKWKNSGKFHDFVVENTFLRNQWNEMLIVTDLTMSMKPYLAQLFMWLQLNNFNEVNQIVFFNDGDNKQDKEKKIGSTGGIYTTKSKDYAVIKALALECMKNGKGGDNPENDLEAILAGIEECPDCKEAILIADKESKVRDIKLLDKIPIPVRVILCGEDKEINTQYLDIARQTKGSIHLMNVDINDLIRFNEGKIIGINGVKYIIRQGKFQIM